MCCCMTRPKVRSLAKGPILILPLAKWPMMALTWRSLWPPPRISLRGRLWATPSKILWRALPDFKEHSQILFRYIRRLQGRQLMKPSIIIPKFPLLDLWLTALSGWLIWSIRQPQGSRSMPLSQWARCTPMIISSCGSLRWLSLP